MAKICYYGDKISPNIAKTPEGFIICKNVPIARTGYQQYLSSELFSDGTDDEIVDVYRPEKEVFSKNTLASFEGKAVTNGHPDVDVTPENYSTLAAGHVQNVRQGTGKDSNKIMADLYITDPTLISEVMNEGKRQVSAGYYADDVEDEDGRICQTQIRGNHVAVVDKGRAGQSVAIRDSLFGGKKAMSTKRKALARILKKYINDAKPSDLKKRLDEVSEIISDDDDIVGADDVGIYDGDELEDEDVIEDEDPIEDEDEPKKDAKKDSKKGKKDKAPIEDDDELDVISEDDDPIEDDDELDVISEDDDPIEDDDELDVISEDDDPIEDDDEMLEDDDEDGAEFCDDDEVAESNSVKDAVMKIRNRRDRARVINAMKKARKRRNGRAQMTGLLNVVRKNQGARRDSVSNKTLDVQRQQNAYDKLNPHKQH